jgi:hypothetical protein
MLRQSAQQSHPPIVAVQPFGLDLRLRGQELAHPRRQRRAVYNMHRGGMRAHVIVKFALEAFVEFQTSELVVEPGTQAFIQPVDAGDGKLGAQCTTVRRILAWSRCR